MSPHIGQKCPHLKCYRWNVAGVCYSGRPSRCLRNRLEGGGAFPIPKGLCRKDPQAWAWEVIRLWKKAGLPVLVGGVATEQARLAMRTLDIGPETLPRPEA